MSHVGTITNNSLLGEISKVYLAQPCIIVSKWVSNGAAGLLIAQVAREEIRKDVGTVETGGRDQKRCGAVQTEGGDQKRCGEGGDGGKRSEKI